MRIAVAGGTGVVGRHVIDQLEAAGHQPVTLARSAGVDLVSGRGLDAALEGVTVVVDVVSVVTTRARAAVDFFTAATRNLLAAGQHAGVGHHVALSIVGIDDQRLGGYYAGKRAQEATIVAGPVPWSILRATQFHEFAGQLMQRAAVGRVSLVPKMLVQPVAAREVATALCGLATAEPGGRVPDLAGPKLEQLVDMGRRQVRSRSERRLIIPIRLPGKAGKAALDGALTPTSDGARGALTFEDWLNGPDACTAQ